MRRFSLPALLVGFVPMLAFGQSYTVSSPVDASHVVLRVPGESGWWRIQGAKGNHYGQKTSAGAVVIVPELKAKTPVNVELPKAQIQMAAVPMTFEEKAGQYVDVKRGNQAVLRFMNMKRDGSSKDQHEMTFKPFHHVFAPDHADRLLTNGAGLAANKENLFPHHRGLFYAFNKISYGSEKCDVWHGRNNEYVEFDKMLETESGPTMAMHKAALSWHGTKGDVFASEVRTVTVYAVPDGTMLDFESTLTTKLEKVALDGDPQHAGFHFRAAMEVSKNGKQNTYYVRPDGVGKPGETRNWDAKGKDPKTINLPWDACSFVVQGQRYTVLRVPHPDNPKDTRGSERDYGRFGDYFEWVLTPAKPLTVKYRILVKPGEMTVKECQAIANGFTAKIDVKPNS